MKLSKRPLTYFLTALLALWIGGLVIWKVSSNRLAEKKQNNIYTVQEIVQTSMCRQALKTQHLAEIIHLGVDMPVNLYSLDLEKAEAKLKDCPLIIDAKIKRKPPHSLHIDYTACTPVALVGDYYNTAIDEEGHLFPYAPFLAPKALPEVVFGIESFKDWQTPPPHFKEALHLIRLFKENHLSINYIDLSRLKAESLGRRELIIKTGHHYLRLPSQDYAKQLGNYVEFAEEIRLHEQETGMVEKVIDLRIPNLAFMDI